tara:strand:+ start:160 stop:288 length:129 start_codon:yes stop_codon:yes gene_type:complete
MNKALFVITIALFSVTTFARSGASELRYRSDFGLGHETALKV